MENVTLHQLLPLHQLLSLLRKPARWQRSSEPFWDDEHISKGMLEAHLTPDREAASRRHSFIDRSAEWLASIIPAKSRILDLGCGPGLYTKRLSDMGYDMTGIDLSKRSLAYAKEQDKMTLYLCRNYLEADYPGTFDAVTLIYCDYAALAPAEKRVLLSKVYQALKPGGLFIFDVFTEQTFKGKCDSTAWACYENGGFWSERPHVCLQAEYFYENNTVKVDQYIILTDEGIREYRIWDSVYSKQTLLDEVLPFGFEAEGIYDDVIGSPYTGKADTLCAVLKKADSPSTGLKGEM